MEPIDSEALSVNMNTMNLKTSHSLTQPLPPELLAEVMISLINSLAPGDHNKERRTLCLVCRLWRDIVLSTPSLWSVIFIDVEDFHPNCAEIERAVDLSVRRAGNLDLSLEMKPLKNRVTWRSDVDVLLWRYAERWVHLRLWGVFPQNLMRRTLEEDGEEDEEDEGWKEVKGHSTVTWSKLRTLVFTGPTYIALSPAPSLPCFDMPKLTSLTSRGDIKASDLKLLPLQQLVYIALEGDRYGGALKQVLKACTGVKELVVLDVVTYDDDIVIEVEEGVASRNWTPLIHLAQLRVRGMTTFLYVLSSIRFPHLQSLHIDLASEGQQGGFVGTLNMRSNGRGFVAWFLQKRVLGSGCSETLTKLVLSALFGTLGASQQIFEFLVSLTALIHLDLSDELHDVDFLKQLNAEKGVACLEHIRLETLAVVSGSGGDKMKYAFDRFVDERGHWALDGERFASYDWSARIRFAEFVATANDVFDLLS